MSCYQRGTALLCEGGIAASGGVTRLPRSNWRTDGGANLAAAPHTRFSKVLNTRAYCVVRVFIRKEPPDMMSASEGAGGSWKSGHSKGGCMDFILEICSKFGQGGRGVMEKWT